MGCRVKIVRVLLAHKANPNYAIDWKTAPVPVLHAAVQCGYTEVAQALLDGGPEQKAEVNKVDTHTRTPLLIAAPLGNTALIKLLIERKASIDQCTINNENAIFLAAQAGHKEVVDLLTNTFRGRRQGQTRRYAPVDRNKIRTRSRCSASARAKGRSGRAKQ